MLITVHLPQGKSCVNIIVNESGLSGLSVLTWGLSFFRMSLFPLGPQTWVFAPYSLAMVGIHLDV